MSDLIDALSDLLDALNELSETLHGTHTPTPEPDGSDA